MDTLAAFVGVVLVIVAGLLTSDWPVALMGAGILLIVVGFLDRKPKVTVTFYNGDPLTPPTEFDLARARREAKEHDAGRRPT